MRLKYVIVKGGYFNDHEVPILFPELHEHARVAAQPVSAGFCAFSCTGDTFHVSVWGESTSCNVKSRPEDAAIIEKEFNPFKLSYCS